MAKQLKYRAVWANGEYDTRRSHRTYTHAWRVIWERGDTTGSMSGFSGSQRLAEAARAQHAASLGRYYAVGSSEVVAVEVI